MAVATVKASSSTWVRKIAPSSNFASSSFDYITENATYTARSFIYAAPSIPAGSVVSSATLTIYLGACTHWGALSLTQVTSRIADSQKTWNRQPTIGTVGAGAAATISPGSSTEAQPVTFDVTAMVQAWVNGTANFGWEVRNSDTGSPVSIGRYGFYGAKSAHPPVLSVTYTSPPDTPHNLMPAGTISITKPIVTFGPYGDPDGDLLQAVQVQVAATSTSFSTPTFDSGAITATDPSLDLSTTAFSGFSGTTQYWRARVQDATGAWSAWADPVAVTVTAKPTVTFSSPSVGSPFVNESTPQIVWSATGQTSFHMQILDATTLAVVADSGRVPSATGQWGIPASVIEPDGSYTAQVDVYDVTRSPSPGDPVYTRQQQPFTFTPGATVTPTSVVVASGPDWPGQVILQCTDTTAPDYFTVYLDGKPVLTQVSPGEALVSGSTYQFVIDHCPTGQHTFQVDAVTAGVASAPSAVVTYNNVISGIWIGDPTRKLWAVIHGTASTDQWAMKDNVTVTQPIDGTIPQQIIRSMNGLAGTCTGTLSNKLGMLPVAQYEANLMALKGQPQNTLRLVYGSKNIPVKVSNLSVSQASDSSANNPRRNVSFDFFQCGELPFTVSL